MSLYINFEPHAWYRGFAIKNNKGSLDQHDFGTSWYAVTANGMTGYLVEFESATLKDLKEQISRYTTNESARINRLYAGQSA